MNKFAVIAMLNTKQLQACSIVVISMLHFDNHCSASYDFGNATACNDLWIYAAEAAEHSLHANAATVRPVTRGYFMQNYDGKEKLC